jgi:hypothetical protein
MEGVIGYFHLCRHRHGVFAADSHLASHSFGDDATMIMGDHACIDKQLLPHSEKKGGRLILLLAQLQLRLAVTLTNQTLVARFYDLIDSRNEILVTGGA